MTLDKKVDLVLILMGEVGNLEYPRQLVSDVLEQSEIFHVLVTAKVLKKDFEIPKLEDLNNLLKELTE